MSDYKEYIYAVYQEKSFSRAAQKLYVSQPWLSATVKKIEQSYNCQLFDRNTTPISLTEAGKYYIEHIEQIMSIEEEMRRHFKELHDTAGMELHIGSSMFFCTYVLPTLLSDFRAIYPQITVTFSEGTGQILLDKLLDGTLDFLLESELPDSDKLTTLPWASEELILAVPAGYGINSRLSEYCYTFEEFLLRRNEEYHKPAVPLREFQDESFILLKEGNDSHSRSVELCGNAGFTPKVSLYLSQMMTAYYLVCEGQGITFLRSTIPEYVAPTKSVVFYRLDDPLAVRDIYLSYPKKKSSPVRQHLIDFMLEKRLSGSEYHI